jgi:hypothetical protein
MPDDSLTSSPNVPLVPLRYESAELLAQAWAPAQRRLVLPLAPGVFAIGSPVAMSILVEGRPGRLIIHGRIGEVVSEAQSAALTETDVPRLSRAIETLLSSPGAPLRQERYIIDDAPVHFVAPGLEGVGKVKNVSDGGCFVATAGALPAQGTSVSLEIKAPDSIFGVAVAVTVMRVVTEGQRGFGVHFDEGQAEKVERFIYAAMVTL